MKTITYIYSNWPNWVLLVLLCWVLPNTPKAQISVESTSGMQLEATGDIQLEVSGDWQHQGTFTPGLSTVLLDGSGNQGLLNTSGDDGGYGDYQSISTTLNQGGIYPITLTPGYAGAAFNEYWRVFIDWNQDGQLNPQTELAAFGYGSGLLSGNLQVPGTASLGNTLMRVVVSYDGWPTVCTTGFAGETEDYTVTITGSSALQQGDLPDFKIASAAPTEMEVYPNPTEGQVQIDLTGIAAETGNLIIRDVNGQIVYQQVVDRWEQTRFDLNLKEQDLPAGSYFIQYQTAEDLYTRKLILTD
ncbi:MAG: GEVED domain-containing protein [Bacteroidota bacterium]